MANGVFNIAKGRVGEYYNRVKSNDPANAGVVIVAIKAAGVEADAALIDHDDLAALLAAANDEATNAGYARIVLTDADLAAVPAPDDANERYDFDLPNQTWAAVAAAGGAWAKALVCYDPDVTAGADGSIIPLCHYDFPVTPDGSDIELQFNAAGFFRAEEP